MTAAPARRAERWGGGAGGGASRIPPIVIAGVSGSGKSTVGPRLAQRLGVDFLDADALHPPANLTKLRSGEPLDDADRQPWLDRVGEALAGGEAGVIACSALKLAYRDRLRRYAPDLVVVQLEVPAAVLEERLATRTGHFMAPSLLASQLATLEPLAPGERGFALGGHGSPKSVVDAILARLAGCVAARLGENGRVTTQLELARDDFRARIGTTGIWRRSPDLDPAFAVAAERAGYGSLWVGGSPPADLGLVEQALEATEQIVVATGIVNIWAADAREVAASYHRIEAAHPGRFILGIGAGHPERHEQAAKPYTGLVDYLDVLEAEGVPAERLMLAALGDRVLRLSAERTLGAHPYFVPPAHSSRAREVMGASALLIPEQRVLLERDPAVARETLRPGMAYYFDLTNYRTNLLRLGLDQAEIDAHSDAAVDELAAWGDPAAVRDRLDAHLAAGADHVVVQFIVGEGDDVLAALAQFAAAIR